MTYTERVAAAFAAYITFYSKLHENHDRKASSIFPSECRRLATEAVEMSIEMQRAFLALIGSHRRRTYAHDFVYGLHQIYMTFGKPWNVATEGNEHAHQEMKKFFHHLCCHNRKAEHGSCYQILRLRLVKQQLMNDFAKMFLPWTEYAAMRCNKKLGLGTIIVDDGGGALIAAGSPADGAEMSSLDAEKNRRKKRRQEAITIKGEKQYKCDTKMIQNCENIRNAFDQC